MFVNFKCNIVIIEGTKVKLLLELQRTPTAKEDWFFYSVCMFVCEIFNVNIVVTERTIFNYIV